MWCGGTRLMVRSLFFKLIGAFALVILALAAVVTVLARQATADQFRAYTDRSGQLWAQQLAPALSNYYSASGTWQGVSAAIKDPALVAGQTVVASASPRDLPSTPRSAAGVPTPTPPAGVSLPSVSGQVTPEVQPGNDITAGTGP